MLILRYPDGAVLDRMVARLYAKVNAIRPSAAPRVAGMPMQRMDPVEFWWEVDGWTITAYTREDGVTVFSWGAPNESGSYVYEDCGKHDAKWFYFWPEGHEARIDAWPADPTRPLERLSM